MLPRLTMLLVCACAQLMSCRRAPAPAAASAPATSAGGAGPRIVSTVPAATLNLSLLGAADKLVGVTKYDTLFLPPAQQNLPIVGDYETMNYEQLVALRPSALIIQIASSRISPRLREITQSQHIELVNLRFDHISDIWESVRTLGRVAGMQEAADRAIGNAKADLDALKIDYAYAPHPRVLYLVSPPPSIVIAGKNTFIEEMIQIAGGRNAGADAGPDFPEIGREALIHLQPEVLLIGAPDQMEALPNDPRLAPYQSLPVPAARNKRIYLVTDGNALIASVAIGKNIRSLAALIHAGDPAPAPPASRPLQSLPGSTPSPPTPPPPTPPAAAVQP